ncbi:hypothetical protein Hhis01_03839 [Haloarcula hispanica]
MRLQTQLKRSNERTLGAVWKHGWIEAQTLAIKTE